MAGCDGGNNISAAAGGGQVSGINNAGNSAALTNEFSNALTNARGATNGNAAMANMNAVTGSAGGGTNVTGNNSPMQGVMNHEILHLLGYQHGSEQANLANNMYQQAKTTPINPQVADMLTQGLQNGKLQMTGDPNLSQNSLTYLAQAASVNPNVAQDLARRLSSGNGLTIQSQNSGPSGNPNVGNSQVDRIGAGGNKITLDYGDLGLASRMFA